MVSRTLLCCVAIFLTVLTVSSAAQITTAAPKLEGKSVVMVLQALPGKEVMDEETFKDKMLIWWTDYCTMNSTNKCGFRPSNSSTNATAYYIDDLDEPEPSAQDTVPVDIKIVSYKRSDDKKSANAEFVVIAGDSPLEPDIVADTLNDNKDQLKSYLGVQETEVTVPKKRKTDSMAWVVAIVVVVIAMLVVLLVGLVIALRRRHRTEEMFNLNTRAGGDGSQYLGQRPLSQSFDNAAYNSSTQTVRIGSFDEKK